MAFDLATWLLVFIRVSALLSVFPLFSSQIVPVQIRTALGIFIAFFVSGALLPYAAPIHDLSRLIVLMSMEAVAGFLLGFVARIIFYALDFAGSIITAEIGLSVPPSMSPFSENSETIGSTLLRNLAGILWLTLDMHHWLLLGMRRSYDFLPIGGVHFGNAVAADLMQRTTQSFFVGLQIAAPVVAVSFIITLVFSVMARAVPQMNVFTESFAIRITAGLLIFGISCQVMAQQIAHYLHRLSEDMLRFAQLMGVQ